jgi:hypothetical protein
MSLRNIAGCASFILGILFVPNTSHAQKALMKRCDSSIIVQSGMNAVTICKKIQDTAKCPPGGGVWVRIHNAGSKPISKYILTDRDDNNKLYFFDGLRPEEYSPYQCVTSINVPFDNDLNIIIQTPKTDYSDITSRDSGFNNVIKSGKVTIELSCDYDDSAELDPKSLKRTFLIYPPPETVVDQH